MDGLVFGGDMGRAGTVVMDMLIALGWASIGLVFTCIAVRRIRNGGRQDLM